MTARKILISADSFRFAVADVVSDALNPIDCDELPIVAGLTNGKFDIVDGYHRIAGMIAWGVDMVECVLCDDEELIGVAGNAERPAAQREALDAIYAMVK